MTRRLCLLVLFLVTAVTSVEAAAAARVASWRELPYGACRFVQDQFGATPDAWQEQLLVAFANPAIQRISLQACAGPGKTCGEAWCGWWFMSTQVSRDGTGYEHPKGLVTSVTKENLRDNLWTEFAKWQGRSEYLRTAFAWSETRIFERNNPATWFLSARTWPKSGSAEEQGRTFSGLHGKNVLVEVDESGSIPSTILRAAEQALPNTHFAKVLQAGNPISLEGMLYEAQMKAHLWHIIRVTGDPEDPNAWVNAPRVSQDVAAGQQSPKEWALEQIQTYGRDNPWVMAYILGKFPPASINQLLTLEQVLEAQARDPHKNVYAHLQKRIGVDVARFGDDRTVLWPRQGAKSWKPVVMRGADTNAIVARIMRGVEAFGSELELIDNSFAWGNGVVDNLRNAGRAPYAVNFAAPGHDPRFENLRAQMWIRATDAIKQLGHALPANVPELAGELSTPTYTFSRNGAFLLEPKDQVKKRLGRSPDLGDAWALTYVLPDQVANAQRFSGGAAPGKAATDYDPMERG